VDGTPSICAQDPGTNLLVTCRAPPQSKNRPTASTTQNSDRPIGGILPLSHLFPTKRTREGREKRKLQLPLELRFKHVQTDSCVLFFFQKKRIKTIIAKCLISNYESNSAWKNSTKIGVGSDHEQQDEDEWLCTVVTAAARVPNPLRMQADGSRRGGKAAGRRLRYSARVILGSTCRATTRFPAGDATSHMRGAAAGPPALRGGFGVVTSTTITFAPSSAATQTRPPPAAISAAPLSRSDGACWARLPRRRRGASRGAWPRRVQPCGVQPLLALARRWPSIVYSIIWRA